MPLRDQASRGPRVTINAGSRDRAPVAFWTRPWAPNAEPAFVVCPARHQSRPAKPGRRSSPAPPSAHRTAAAATLATPSAFTHRCRFRHVGPSADFLVASRGGAASMRRSSARMIAPCPSRPECTARKIASVVQGTPSAHRVDGLRPAVTREANRMPGVTPPGRGVALLQLARHRSVLGAVRREDAELA